MVIQLIYTYTDIYTHIHIYAAGIEELKVGKMIIWLMIIWLMKMHD